MKNEKVIRVVKIVVTCAILFLFLWLLFIYPLGSFNKSESTMVNAAKKYYEINSAKLPQEGKISTVDLSTLYDENYLGALYVPYTKTLCTTNESWVKVKRENGNYKYYTYLKCGVLSSNVDHEGPKITLNGEEKVKVELGSAYKDPGVKSVYDDTDGKIDVKEVTVSDSGLDTNEIGTYTITYSVKDSFKNETKVERTIEVVKSLASTVKKDTDDTNFYKGKMVNNYIRISGILFRIVNLNSDGSVKVVSDEPLANVNYTAIDDWNNDYFYGLLSNDSKKFIKKDSTWCGSTTEDITVTKCDGKTTKNPIGNLNISDYNNTSDKDESTFLKSKYFIWANDDKDADLAYIYSSKFNTTKLYAMDKSYNFGVKPAFNIVKNTYLIDGTGTEEDPYEIGDVKKEAISNKINTRYTGEYVEYSGYLWRILSVNDDKTTNVVMDDTVSIGGRYNASIKLEYDKKDTKLIYNPTEKGNLGYKVSHELTKYLKTDYFVERKITVPIYKEDILYNKETSTKKYNVKIAIPSMYDAYSATARSGYWLINSSQDKNTMAMVSGTGIVYYGKMYDTYKSGVKIKASLANNIVIKGGNGTFEDPYQLTK